MTIKVRIFLEGLFHSSRYGKGEVRKYMDNHTGMLSNDKDYCSRLLTECGKLYGEKRAEIEKKHEGLYTSLYKNMDTIADVLYLFPRGAFQTHQELSALLFSLLLSVFHFEQRFSSWWVTCYRRLGMVYYRRIAGSRENNIKMAFHCLQHSLKGCSKRYNAEVWANVQANFGYVHVKAAHLGDTRNHIEMAIPHFQKALFVYHPHHTSLFSWAYITRNLAKAYAARMCGCHRSNFTICLELLTQAL